MNYRNFSSGAKTITLLLIVLLTAGFAPEILAGDNAPAGNPSPGLQLYFGGGGAFPQEDLKEASKTAWMITLGASLMHYDFVEGDLFVSYKHFSTKNHELMDYYDIHFDDFQITGIYGEMRVATTQSGSYFPYFLMDAGISILSGVPDLESINADLNRLALLIGFGAGLEIPMSQHYTIWIDGKYCVTSFGGTYTGWGDANFNIDCNHFTAQAGIKYSFGK